MADNHQAALRAWLAAAYEEGQFMSDFDDWLLNMHENHTPLISAFGSARAQELLKDIRQMDQVKQFIARWNCEV